MAKKKHILNDEQPPCTVIGIASHERAYKIASMLNSTLGISLVMDGSREATESVPSLYEDFDSLPNFEVLFFEREDLPSKAPKLAKPFRFWLVFVHHRLEDLQTAQIMTKLKSINEVSLALDLSQEKDIHQILP